MMSNINITKESLNELLSDNPSLLELNLKYCHLVCISENTDSSSLFNYKIVKEFCISGDNRKNEINKTYKQLEIQKIVNVEKALNVYNKIKHTVITKLNEAYIKRFESFDTDIFVAMGFIDPARWNMSEKDKFKSYGVNEIELLSIHFDKTLKVQGYNVQKCLSEWKCFKVEVKAKYLGKKCIDLFQYFFLH
ncbi:hypothetical protein SNE40_002875 [Patella caerulea]|uniref:Uncharacterized protein n=1 Tax=Patella caerulea TaxID=87958 RepID=A0AAN8Q0A7_PATCE